ncbi:glutathione S-transferase [Roseobacter sp. GAI101]|nr:glutathione S-transferase [Roseobacter sp. GAI101]
MDRDKKTSDGRDFNRINPKGYTPALELEDGTILTESLAILMYIAEYSGKLLAKEGDARWRTVEATEFMTTELHANFRPFFSAGSGEDEKNKAKEMLARRFATLESQLGENQYLIGKDLTIADAYLFVMLSWARMMGIDVPERLGTYATNLLNVPSVTVALSAEGLA